MVDVIQSIGDMELGNALHDRAVCNRQKSDEIICGLSPTPFRDIRGDGNGRSAQLTSQSKPFIVRKRSSASIDLVRKLNRLLPNIQFFKPKHRTLPQPSTLNPQLNGYAPHADLCPLLIYS